jgi:peroxiredoxin
MLDLLLVSSVLLWLVVGLNLLLTLALVRKINSGTPRPLKKGQRAPDFTAQTLTGEQVTLASYAGRSVALIAVSPSCGPCREALPRYEALAPKARRAGVELLLVSTAPMAESQAFVEELAIHAPLIVAPEPDNSFMRDYKLAGTPSYCLIDAQGKVQSSGFPSSGEWQALTETWESHTHRVAELAANAGG